jgi:hypothetical protein
MFAPFILPAFAKKVNAVALGAGQHEVALAATKWQNNFHGKEFA